MKVCMVLAHYSNCYNTEIHDSEILYWDLCIDSSKLNISPFLFSHVWFTFMYIFVCELENVETYFFWLNLFTPKILFMGDPHDIGFFGSRVSINVCFFWNLLECAFFLDSSFLDQCAFHSVMIYFHFGCSKLYPVISVNLGSEAESTFSAE